MKSMTHSLELLFIIIIASFTQTQSNSITITPTTITDTVQINTDKTVLSSQNEWNLTAPTNSTQNTWSFQMEIQSNDFQFQPLTESTLTITVYGSNNMTESDLFIGFGLNNKYFVVGTDLDGSLIINGKNGIHIYPNCDSNTGLANGNISTINPLWIMYTQWTMLSNLSNNNEFPLIFEIKNDPLKNASIFTLYSNTFSAGISCTFQESFAVNQNLHFMLNPYSQNQSIQISHLLISLYTTPLYILNENALNWEDANSFCMFNYGTSLASVHNSAQNIEALKLFNGMDAFIGLSDEEMEGVWKWLDGTVVTETSYTNWNDGKPSNGASGHSVRYVCWSGVGKYFCGWNDGLSSSLMQSLCNYPIPTQIINEEAPLDLQTFSGKIGEMDILDEIVINFDIEIESLPQNVSNNILTIGNVSEFVYILIGINANKSFVIKTMGINNTLTEHKSDISSVPETIYHFSLHQSQTHFLWILNDLTISNVSKDSHPIMYDQQIVLGTIEMNSETMNGSISNLEISSNNLVVPGGKEFNYLCDDNRFDVISGHWTFDEERCSVVQNNDTTVGAAIWMGDKDPSSMKWTNYKLETDITLHSGSQVAILFRAQTISAVASGGQHYFMAVRLSHSDLVLSKVNNGWIELAKPIQAIESDKIYTLRVEAFGNNLDVYLDNMHKISVTDNSYSFGSVGLRTSEASATFSSLKIMFASDNCLNKIWRGDQCNFSPKCFYLKNETKWTMENGANITQNTIYSGVAYTTTKMILNECFYWNSSSITLVGFIFQYYLNNTNDFRYTNDFNTLQLGIQTISGCYNSFILFQSDALSEMPKDGQIFNDLITTHIVLNDSISIPDDNYQLFIQFENNNNSIYIDLDTLSVHIRYRNDTAGLIFDDNKVNYNTYLNGMITHLIAVDDRFVDTKIVCNETNNCVLQCGGINSCSSSTFYVENNMVIQCNETYSCYYLNIKSLTKNASLTMLCTEKNSCFRMTVEIDNPNRFNLFCTAEQACNDAVIKLNYSQANINLNNNNGIIECIAFSSCDNIEIITSSAKTKLIMYEYSQNVLFNNGFGYVEALQNIDCNMDRLLYVSMPMTTQTITTLISAQYTQYLLPCAAVNVECTQSSCAMQYDLNNETINNLEEHECVVINLTLLQNVNCMGNCSATLSPTFEPTNNPTLIPIYPPTRRPTTENSYNYYFDMICFIDNIQKNDITKLENNTFTVVNHISNTMEEAFVNDDNVHLQFFAFWIKIENINGNKINKINENTKLSQYNEWKLKTKVLTQLAADAKDLKQANISSKGALVKYVTENIRKYFGNPQLVFYIDSDKMSAIKELYPDYTETDYYFYGLLSLTFVIILVGMYAFLWNKQKICGCPGFYIVDDGNWMSLIVLSLQFYDFISDILLDIELWSRSDIFDNQLILIAAVGSTLFLVLPYTLNIIIAIHIKSMAIIKQNEFTTNWLTNYSRIYTAIVVLTGGAYPALSVVSSNIFGHKLFSAGLTKLEINKLSKIKMWSTVVFENVPQLSMQILYAFAIRDTTTALLIAFVASALSILASIISYCIDRTQDGMVTEQYDLIISCKDKNKSDNIDQKSDDYDVDELKVKLRDNKGRTEALRKQMAMVFGVEAESIQIGSSTLLKNNKMNGLKMHFVHSIPSNDLGKIQLFNATQNDGNYYEFGNDSDKMGIPAKMFINALYRALNEDIIEIFRNHLFGTGDVYDVEVQLLENELKQRMDDSEEIKLIETKFGKLKTNILMKTESKQNVEQRNRRQTVLKQTSVIVNGWIMEENRVNVGIEMTETQAIKMKS
eukprot:527913_1